MKALSIDVGIKNLAYCILEINEGKVMILEWDTISLCDKEEVCNFVTKKGLCNKKATYVHEGKTYCKVHSKKSELIEYKSIPSQKKLEEKSIEDIMDYVTKYNLDVVKDKYKRKSELVKVVVNKLKEKSLKEIKRENAGKIELVKAGIGIKREINKLELGDIDLILIENQIGPLANRMKCIQSMLIQYFIMIGKENIECVSSSNKLKFLKTKKLTYKENKDLSKIITNKYLDEEVSNKDILDKFRENKKKDDLADAFLQGCAYLIENKKIDNIFNYADDLK